MSVFTFAIYRVLVYFSDSLVLYIILDFIMMNSRRR